MKCEIKLTLVQTLITKIKEIDYVFYLFHMTVINEVGSILSSKLLKGGSRLVQDKFFEVPF